MRSTKNSRMNIIETVEKQCRLKSDKTAVIFKDVRLSYKELLERIKRIQANLSISGVKKGSRAAVLSYNSADMLCLILALLRSGVCITLLNFREKAEDLSALISQTDSDFLLCCRELMSVAAGLAPNPRENGLISIDDLLCEQPEACSIPPSLPQDDEPILNIFTGGTTGTPKAACHTYGSLGRHIESCYSIPFPLEEDDVFLNYAPIFHIGGFTAALQTICRGATFIISEAFKPADLIDFVAREKVTQMSLIPPSLCSSLTECANFSSDSLASVRMVRMSGGACTAENVSKVFALFPNAKIFCGYGMSERAVNMVQVIASPDECRMINGNISVGKPGAGEECRLTDENGQVIKKPFTAGELYAKSPCMMQGYYKRSDSFDDEGWFHTGDIFFFDDDGYYYFADRKKDMIKSGGENVYSGTVEQVLNRHPAVKCSAVVGVPDARLGETVAAAIVLNSGAAADEKDIADWCAGRLAGFRKPRKFLFVDELPRSNIGKIKKSEVRKLFEKN